MIVRDRERVLTIVRFPSLSIVVAIPAGLVATKIVDGIRGGRFKLRAFKTPLSQWYVVGRTSPESIEKIQRELVITSRVLESLVRNLLASNQPIFAYLLGKEPQR